MQKQTLEERATNQKEKLAELFKMAIELDEACGRDTEISEPQFSGPLNWDKNWNKGWGKYGKT